MTVIQFLLHYCHYSCWITARVVVEIVFKIELELNCRWYLHKKTAVEETTPVKDTDVGKTARVEEADVDDTDLSVQKAPFSYGSSLVLVVGLGLGHIQSFLSH